MSDEMKILLTAVGARVVGLSVGLFTFFVWRRQQRITAGIARDTRVEVLTENSRKEIWDLCMDIEAVARGNASAASLHRYLHRGSEVPDGDDREPRHTAEAAWRVTASRIGRLYDSAALAQASTYHYALMAFWKKLDDAGDADDRKSFAGKTSDFSSDELTGLHAQFVDARSELVLRLKPGAPIDASAHEEASRRGVPRETGSSDVSNS